MSDGLTPQPPLLLGEGEAQKKSPLAQGRALSPQLLARARALRGRETPVEDILWEFLRARRLGGLKFRRQHPVGKFVLDFYCHEARLSVELDGKYHQEQQRYDQERSAQIRALGARELRFSNEMVYEAIEGVLLRILDEAGLTPQPPLLLGEGEEIEQIAALAPDVSPLFPLSQQERGQGGEAPLAEPNGEQLAKGAEE